MNREANKEKKKLSNVATAGIMIAAFLLLWSLARSAFPVYHRVSPFSAFETKKLAPHTMPDPDVYVNIGIDNNTLSDFTNAGIIQNVEVRPIENIPQQTEERTQISLVAESKSDSLFPETEEIPIVGNENTKITFDISGRKYILNYSIKKENSEEKWLVVSEPKENKEAYEFDVEWNIAHPFFKYYFVNQEIFDSMKKFVFALVLSEIEATYTSSNDKKIEPWDIREKMNETLKAVIRS